MDSKALKSLVAGSAFGFALTKATVFPPTVIIDQLLLRNMHMLRVFLTATSISTLTIAAFAKTRPFKPVLRPPLALGLFSPYDANIIGGTMIGVGMALTGACPGTIFPQLATGFVSAYIALPGALAGGLAWVLIEPKLNRQAAASERHQWTLEGRLGLGKELTIFEFIILCMVIVCLSSLLDGGMSPLLHGIEGGLAIGIAQFISISLTDNTIGSSKAYEEAGKWTLSFAKMLIRDDQMPAPPYLSLLFAGGALLGSLVLTLWNGTFAQGDGASWSIWAGFIGGACLSFGARLAGGCTSGHGISGMATLSIASFVSVAAMFGGGMLAAQLLL